MKKKVFSLMMTLLLAFMGVAKAEIVEIGDGGTATNSYLPNYEFYNYSITQQIYTADEIGTAGTINSIAFYYTGTATRTLEVYMVNTTVSSFASNNDWITVTAADKVYSGSVTYAANEWCTITLDTPFAYDGTSNLAVIVDDNTGSYVSSVGAYVFDATGMALRNYNDNTNFDPTNPAMGSGAVLNLKNQIQLDITPGGGGGGAAVPYEAQIGEGTSTTGYFPFYTLYNYSIAENLFLASELTEAGVQPGEVTSLSWYATNETGYAQQGISIWMANVNDTELTVDSHVSTGMTLVYTGSVTPVTGWNEFTCNAGTFTWDGTSNVLILCQRNNGDWNSTINWQSGTVDFIAMSYRYQDTGAYDVTVSNIMYTSTSRSNIIIKGVGNSGGGGPVDVLYALQDGVEVETIEVGPRPIGCWMEPFTFQLRNDGPATTLNLIDFTPTDYFTVVAPELPVAMAHNEEIDVQLTTGTSTDTLWQMVAIYGEGRTARVWDIVAEPYTPGVPDVVETAYDLGTVGNGFSYQGVPSQITPTVLHNDYTLPFPEIEEGEDAVYKFTVAQDMIINAYVDTVAENGKVALYTEDFYGEGGPMANNNYTGLDLNGTGGGGAAGAPFEAQIGEGTSTSGYFPFYSLYNYSLSAELFLAAELAEAGVTTAPFTSLSWNATNSISQDQNGITIWMANVADTQVPAMSPLASGMTKVYTGNLTQPTPTGWVEFVFNEGTFSWDGSSNILILCQRNNGSWTSSIQWQYHNPGFLARGYDYTDNAAYNVETAQYSWYTSSTTRANVIMKGGNREGNRDVVTEGFEGGSLPAGWTMYNCHSSSGVTSGYTTHEGNYLFRFYYTTNIPQYLISPMLNGTENGVDVSFYYMAYSSSYPETFQVGYSTTTNDVSAFTFGSTITATNTTSYLEYTDSFPAGTKYVAVKCTSDDQFYLFLDDFTFTTTGGGGGGQGGGSTALNVSAGPVIENLGLTLGTYYLVASATEADYEVFINVDNMPCPAIDAEGFAFNPEPADNADEIEPASVTLRWMVPQYATGWRLIFGSTYYPDPNHPQTVMYPEDGSFTNEMATSYTVRNLWNNTNYFWRVEFNNDGCPDGVSSPIWGFTTHLNIPQNLTAVDETVFNDETIVLNWTAVVDRTYRNYFIYRDGVKIGETAANQINATTYTDGPLAYNMNGYVYYVTAVYDEGESAPSNTVTVKVSGRGNVDGHVYEQDGITGIAGATVTMIGQDEFGANHTYNFTTNGQGYYSGAVYAGTYNGSAACDGYQTIYEPVQGNPINITYNVTTSPVDYILDENFDAPCGVIAEYYPDSLDPTSPYVKVYWGCGLPGSDIIEDFETGDFSMFDWQVDPTYPWSITTTNPYEGTYCMKSGGAGVASVTSNMTVSVEIPADGLMSFFGKISSESNYDYGYFFIDGVQKGSWSGAGNWAERTYEVTAGMHTFQWRYSKDSSVNSNDDCFYVDYINFYKQPEPPVPGMTYTFEDGTMQGWTSVDADGDGYGWYMGSEIMTGQTGNNGSSDFVLSQSYYQGMILYPDNYLVSPQVALGGVVTFYACAQDASYAAEHFGVAVSTTNTNPSSFTMLQEWTMTAKKIEGKSMDNAVADVNMSGISRDSNSRVQGNWYQYTVDLSAYAGQTGYVAIRHFNCSDMFYLNVDDITISDPGKGVAESSRSLNHYRVYRTNCYNDGPYTEENTVLLATVWVPDTVYIDVEWADLEPGVYKWGVGAVYEGNRGEMIESPISWAAPVAVGNRSFTTSEAAQVGPKVTKEVAAQDRNRDYLQYSTETFTGGVGTGGGAVYWGIRFPAADLAAYAGRTLTTVGVFTDVDGDYGWTYSGTYTAMVYQGGATAPGTLVSTAAEYLPGDLAWHDITLTTPVTIDATQDLWLCFYTPDIAYPMSGCDYVGNANSDFLSLDGTTWDHAGDYGLSYTWMIRGFVEAGGSTPPTPGGNNLNQLALPRESETIWSNCLDKDMYLNDGDVTVNVLLNSADNPEGIQVSFTNYNEAEQELYPIDPITLDETGYYAFESFRRGDYKVNVTFDGYEPIEDSVHIWEPTDLRYVMIEIIYGVSDLYVSSTGWAMWGDMGTPGGQGGGGGQGGNGDTFSENFDAGMPAGWTTIDGGSPQGYGWHLGSTTLGTGYGHNGSADLVISQSYDNNYGVIYPDNYLVSPQVNLAAGSQFSFWACAQDASYAAEHFGVFISDNGTSNWTMVNEWTIGQKGERYSGARGQRDQSAWTQYTVDLSAFAGQKYIAIRHFNCSDMYFLDVDDVELTNGAKNAEDERHLESFKVLCTSIDGEPIYNANVPAEQPFCQLATDELVAGDHYICKVAAMYSTGMSDWTECEWQYIPCENYAGTVNGVTIEGNEISWEYPGGGGGGGGQGGNGDTFSENFDAGIPAGWTTIDGGSPQGYGWHLGSTTLGTGYGHNGSADLVISQSYDNNYGVIYPDNYLVSPQVNLAAGSQFSFWACAQDASYAAEHFGVFISDNGTSNWTMVNEWTIGQKGERYSGARGQRDQSAWTQYTVDLSAFAGQKYIAIRHFNCSDMYFLDVDDVELTNGAKNNRAAWEFFNGYVTDPGAMANGADASWIKGSQSTWGPNVNNGGGYMLADVFTLDASTTINEIEVYGYQTGSSTTSTFTGLYAQIYNGSPMSGGTAVWGDINTNIMTATAFTNCYRGSDGETTATTRPIMSITAGGLNIELEAGTYYLVYSLAGSGSSGPWGAPHCEPVIGNTGNGLQYTTAWQTLTDSGAGTPYGCAMKLTGNTGGGSGPTPTGDILGAMIFADGEWEAFVEYPTNTYTYEGNAEELCARMVYNGTNNLPEGNIYFSMSCPECEPYMPGFTTCEPGAPIHAEMNQTTDGVTIWWGEEPITPGAGEWYFYDNGANEDAIGTGGGNFWWGVMFPAGSYQGTMVTKVAAYDYMAMTGTVTIYNDGANAPATAVGQMNVTMTGSEDFVEYEFAEPVVIDPTKNVWVVFYNGSGATYPAAVCANTGDANGRWVSLDGSTWEDLASYSLDYTFMIRAYIAQGAKGEVREIAIEQPAGDGGVLAVSGNGARVTRNRANIVKYNVYRSADNETYEFIGEVAEDGSGYYEFVDTPTQGTYYYQVKAYYDNDCESDPAPAYDNPANNYVTVEVTLGIGENDGMAIFPNPTKGNVTIQAAGMQHITIVSVLGQVVYDADVTADEVILNMSQYSAGMYTVRVMTENGIRVERISVVR